MRIDQGNAYDYIKLMRKEACFEIVPMLLVSVGVFIILAWAGFLHSTYDCYTPVCENGVCGCVCEP